MATGLHVVWVEVSDAELGLDIFGDRADRGGFRIRRNRSRRGRHCEGAVLRVPCGVCDQSVDGSAQRGLTRAANFGECSGAA